LGARPRRLESGRTWLHPPCWTDCARSVLATAVPALARGWQLPVPSGRALTNRRSHARLPFGHRLDSWEVADVRKFSSVASLANLEKVHSIPAVSLIFPPLVWSAFDSVYPSIAVLSAFLRQHGIATTQDDLNDEFASFLIDGPLLSRLGAGNVAHLNSR
jgi:hypothetical protein